MTADYEFDLVRPSLLRPGRNSSLDQFTQISEAEERANGHRCSPALTYWTRRSAAGKMQAYGSIDTSPVQPIDHWAWTEFEILPAHPDGKIIRKKVETDVFHFVVRSLKAYRAAALKDLSQPSEGKLVPRLGRSSNQAITGVMDQVVFLEADVRQVFPTDNVSIQTEPSQ